MAKSVLLFRASEVRVMEQRKQHPEQISDEELNSIMDVANYRAGLLDQLEEALRADDTDEVKKYARLLCGIDEKGNRL